VYPHAIHHDDRWWDRNGGVLPCVHLRFDFPHQTIARGQRHHFAQDGIHDLLQVAQTQPQTLPHQGMSKEGSPAGFIPRDGLPPQGPVPPAELGYPQVRNTSILGEEFPCIGAAPGQLWATSPRDLFIARPAQILGSLFLQAVFQGTFDRGDDRLLALLTHGAFDIAWQTMTVDNLQVVIQVAAIMPLRGMAHRGILSSETVEWFPRFYRMSRLWSISRNLPYTTPGSMLLT
jgi:hypothetical protein